MAEHPRGETRKRGKRAGRDPIAANDTQARGGVTMHDPIPQNSQPNIRAREVRIPYQVLLSAATGAGLMYFFDPRSGRHRRTMLRDRSGAIARQTVRRVEHVRKATAAEAYGLKQKVTHLRPEATDTPNGPDLVARVESEVFRDPDIPKGDININAVHEDTIVVRGEVESRAQRRAIERAIKHVHGVRRVENLLHLPGEPAPNKEAAIAASHHAEMHAPLPPNGQYSMVHHD